ncbi:MAG: CPBP family glutamic-type intramembrane protease [Pseudomonadota bacterium]
MSGEPRGRIDQFVQNFLTAPLRNVERESQAYIAAQRGIDWQVMVILTTVAVALTLQEYFFGSSDLRRIESWLRDIGGYETYQAWVDLLGSRPGGQLPRLVLWATGTIITYVLIPVLAIKLILRRCVTDFGLDVSGIWQSSWIYLVMFAGMVPIIFIVSGSERFLETYPFWDATRGEPIWPAFVVFELFYIAQFIALEFFFRGFLLHGTRPRFGVYSIFVMMVPYCMIHFGKPMPETFAAIIAGIILGIMSLKTRSIWFGAAIHVGVALSMDITALWRQGFL